MLPERATRTMLISETPWMSWICFVNILVFLELFTLAQFIFLQSFKGCRFRTQSLLFSVICLGLSSGLKAFLEQSVPVLSWPLCLISVSSLHSQILLATEYDFASHSLHNPQFPGSIRRRNLKEDKQHQRGEIMLVNKIVLSKNVYLWPQIELSKCLMQLC